MIKRRTAEKVTFKWGDACLAFFPVDDRLLDALTITTKELAFDPRTYQKKVVFKSELMLLDKDNTAQARKAMGMPDKDVSVSDISANQISAICKDTGLKTYRDGIASIGAMLGTNHDDEVTPALERKLYVSLQRHCGEVIYTYQGFLVKLVQACVEHGIAFEVDDCRVSREGRDLPQPRLDAMTGFRFSQRELVEKALSSGKSGLIGAPTRYGKTILMINVARAFPDVPIAVVAPGVDLCNQLYGDFTGPFGIKDREVKLICSGSRNTETSATGITICSADSVGKIDSGVPRVLLADEPHALVTDTRVSAINKAFPLARRYGFGATLQGRFDGADPLIEGLFGPVLAERTYKEAVAEGAICPLAVIFFDVYLRDGFSNRDTAYRKLLFESPQMAALTARLCNEVIPQDFQTMLFVKTERQAEVYRNAIGRDTTIAMAKRMNKTERAEVTDLMRRDVIKRCLCTDIYVQGVTFSDVRVLINCEAGGNNTTAIQKPGRLAQVRDGKKCGIVFDFFFRDAYASRRGLEKAECLVRDSAARKKAYTDKGYDIKHVTTMQEALDTFNDLVENGRFTK